MNENVEIQDTVENQEKSKEQLLDAIRKIVEDGNMQAHKEVSHLRQLFFNLRQKETDAELEAFVEAGNDPAAFSAGICPMEVEFKELYTTFKERRAKFLEEEENRRQANLAKKLGVIDEMKQLMEDVDNINRNSLRFTELQAEFKEIHDVPAQAENDVWKQFKAEEERFYDLLKMNKDLRDLDFKKNLEIKQQLIEQARGLEKEEDVIEAARKLQILHNEWRETGPVAKELREDIWSEFKDASTVINKRHQDYFDRRKAAEQENEAAKIRFCEEVEGIDHAKLKTYQAWDNAAEQVKELHKRWKETGPAARKVNNELYARFRKACDAFFEARAEYYRQIKAVYKDNLEKKKALCEKAEALKDRVGERGVRDELKALQAEWKTVGATERRHSDMIWERFMKACNEFYDQLRLQRSDRNAEENANLEAKKALIAKIKELPLDGDARSVISEIRRLQIEYQGIGHVPIKVKDSLQKEYRSACDEVYNAYQESRTRERLNSYQERISKLRGDRKGTLSERDRLVMTLDRKKSDLSTYENNMGFFNVKSSAGSAMLKELERKISRIKEEIAEIRQKISQLDSLE